MKELIEVFRMHEVSAEARCRIIIKLGEAINMEHGMNITEDIVYELLKQLDPFHSDLPRRKAELDGRDAYYRERQKEPAMSVEDARLMEEARRT